MPLLDNPTQFQRLLRLVTKNPMFSTASQQDLSRMLSVVKEQKVDPDTIICQAGQPAWAAYILLEGEYEIEGKVRTFGLGWAGGGIVALPDILEKDPTYTITMRSVSAGRYLSIHVDDLRALRHASPALRQTLMPITPGADFNVPLITPQHHHSLGSVVQFASIVPGLPLSLLIQLLGQEIVTRFPYDQVVIVRPEVPGGTPVITPVPGVPRLYTVEGLPGALDAIRQDYDYVFLDGAPYGPPDLVVELIGGEPEQYQIPSLPNQPTLLQTVVVVEGAPRKCRRKLYWIDSDKMDNTSANSARIRLDIPTLQGLAATFTPGAGPIVVIGTLKNSMYTWARAVTQRRTGIALAGGGVWSMQSIAVLREIHVRGVPIDVISGPSAGAMIGAYYALKGLEGLDLIVAQGDSGMLDLMAAIALISPSLMACFFERTLGDHCLESLDIQYLPGSTNLTTGQGVFFVAGPLALGIAGSSSSTPLVPVTINRRQRFTDGAYSSNVPVQALSYFNASLTFASNTFPAARRKNHPAIPQFMLKMMSMGPINRGLDFTTAFNLMGSLSGDVEGEFASVGWNSRVPLDATFLITTNFHLSSQMVQMAQNDAGLQAKIDEFVSRWEALKNRGAAPGIAPP